MIQLVSPMSAGGAPFSNEDLKLLFNTETFDAIEGIMKGVQDIWSGGSASGNFGIIVTGCQVTGAGPYTVSAGIILIGGKMIRIPQQTGLTAGTWYLTRDASSPFLTNRTFKDLVSHPFLTEDRGVATNIAPGGHYIQFNPSVAGALDAFRLPSALLNSGIQSAINAAIGIDQNWVRTVLATTDVRMETLSANATALTSGLFNYRRTAKETLIDIKVWQATFASYADNVLGIAIPAAIQSAMTSDDVGVGVKMGLLSTGTNTNQVCQGEINAGHTKFLINLINTKLTNFGAGPLSVWFNFTIPFTS